MNRYLGCLFYGCGIWLIAQVFHTQVDYPDGLWFWALGALPFALCLDTLLLHALVAALLAIWVGTEILGFGLLRHPWLFGRWFGLPRACFTLPLMALPGLLWAHKKPSPITVGLYVPLLAWWVILQPIAWHWEVNPIYFIGAAGALFLTIAECHRTGSEMALPYRLYGVLITAGVLAVMSFGDFIREMLRANPPISSLVAGLLIALAGMGAIVGADRLQPKDSKAHGSKSVPLSGTLRRQWLPVGLILLMAGLCIWNGTFSTHGVAFSATRLQAWTPQVILPTLATNTAMIVFAVWLIRVGVREDQGRTFGAGVVLFVLWAVLRYIDLFAEVGGMLGASLMFFICGAALFGMARFWMHRKESGHV